MVHTITLNRADESDLLLPVDEAPGRDYGHGSLLVSLDGEAVGEYSQQQHGWEGLDAIEELVTSLADTLGIDVVRV